MIVRKRLNGDHNLICGFDAGCKMKRNMAAHHQQAGAPIPLQYHRTN